MSGRARELQERHATLLQRCVALRAEAAEEAAMLESGAAWLDDKFARVERWAAHPAVIGAGAVLAFLLVRSRPLRTVGTVLALLPPVLRLTSAGRRFRRRAGIVE